MRIRFVRSEGVEEATHDGGDPRAQVEFTGELLGGQLGGPVNVHGPQHMLLVHGAIGNGVHGRSARHEDLLHAPGGLRGVQHIDRTVDVDVSRFHGVLVAVWDEVDSGQVEHDLRTRIGQHFSGRLARPDVHFEEAIVQHSGQMPAAEAQVVEHGNRMAILLQLLAER
jgi:hypothetical protein